MDKKVTYHEQTDVENTLRLRDVLKTLPPFCKDFFRAIEPRTTTKTRISYAYDIRIFFQFLLEQMPLQWMSWIRSQLLILKNMKNI